MKSLMLLNPRKRNRKRKLYRRNPAKKKTAAVAAPKRRKSRKSRTISVRKSYRKTYSSLKRAYRTKGKGRKRHMKKAFESGKMTLKGILQKEMLITAGGVVAGTFITNWITSKYSNNLPSYNTSVPARLAYNVAIPVLLAVAVAKFNKPLAKGLALSGLATGIQAAVTYAQSTVTSSTVKATGEYLDATPYPQLMAPANYDAVNEFGGSIYTNEPAFSNNPW